MAETEVVKDERPIFRVTQAPGFATGIKMYAPGEEVVWAVPEGWDDKKYGKHFASYGPSTSFDPVNAPAEKLLAEHNEKIKELRRPKPTQGDERFAKMEAMHIEMMSTVLALQAENRRLREDSEEKASKKK